MGLTFRYPAPTMDLRSTLTTAGPYTVLALDGIADVAAIPTLHNLLQRLVTEHGGQHLVVDLDGVAGLDDAALGLLLGAAADARARGGTLAIVCTSERLRQRLTDTRFDLAVRVAASISELSD